VGGAGGVEGVLAGPADNSDAPSPGSIFMLTFVSLISDGNDIFSSDLIFAISSTVFTTFSFLLTEKVESEIQIIG